MLVQCFIWTKYLQSMMISFWCGLKNGKDYIRFWLKPLVFFVWFYLLFFFPFFLLFSEIAMVSRQVSINIFLFSSVSGASGKCPIRHWSGSQDRCWCLRLARGHRGGQTQDAFDGVRLSNDEGPLRPQCYQRQYSWEQPLEQHVHLHKLFGECGLAKSERCICWPWKEQPWRSCNISKYFTDLWQKSWPCPWQDGKVVTLHSDSEWAWWPWLYLVSWHWEWVTSLWDWQV